MSNVTPDTFYAGATLREIHAMTPTKLLEFLHYVENTHFSDGWDKGVAHERKNVERARQSEYDSMLAELAEREADWAIDNGAPECYSCEMDICEKHGHTANL